MPTRADARTGSPNSAALLLLLLIIAFCVLVLVPLVRRYSSLLLLSPSWKRLMLTIAEHDALIASHCFIVIGGPHRGGTTLLWRILAAHPAISGFPEKGIDTDYSEGAFLQTVLPTFGVGSLSVPHSNGGLGRYGFAAASHLTESSGLNSNASARTLLREWAYYWNLSRPVLLEKTPTNMLTSRLLQALLQRRIGGSTPPSTIATASSVRFIFITRHPLAVALAHRRWSCCSHMGVPSLVLHWLHTHRILAADMRHLQAA